MPEYSLREKLPYADAFVLETFRHSECIHVLSPRTTESELVIDGQVCMCCVYSQGLTDGELDMSCMKVDKWTKIIKMHY